VAHLDSFSERTFTDWEISLFEQLGSRTGLIIENKQLIIDTRQHAQSLLLLQEAIARELNCLNPEELHYAIIQSASSLLEADLAGLLLLDTDKKVLHQAYLMGRDQEIHRYSNQEVLSQKVFPVSWILEQKQSYLCRDLSQDPHANQDLVTKEGMNTYLVVRLTDEHEEFGILFLARKENPYTSFDLQTLDIFSKQAVFKILNRQPVFTNC